jgi:hypothetical protein
VVDLREKTALLGKVWRWRGEAYSKQEGRNPAGCDGNIAREQEQEGKERGTYLKMRDYKCVEKMRKHAHGDT